MRSGDVVFVDTSIWIDYFSQKDSALEYTMDLLLENAQVGTAAIIKAELIQGAHGPQEIKHLNHYFQCLTYVESQDQDWQFAGELSFRMRKRGKSVNLTDCYIAHLATKASMPIYSRDKHFAWIAKEGACELFNPLIR